MAQFPSLPLWTDAYLGDTTHLTTIEHGAYLLLLMVEWRSPDCRLPVDDKLLARYAKLSPSQWKRIKPILMPFFTVDGEWMIQGRLFDEYTFVKRNSKRQSQNAKARWLKNRQSGDATAMPRQCHLDAPTPTPTPKTKKKINGANRFGEFWSVYPSRKPHSNPRKPAEIKYEKLVLDGIDQQDIIDGAENYAAAMVSEDTDAKFIKQAITFLNQEIYNDYKPEPLTDSEQDALDRYNGLKVV